MFCFASHDEITCIYFFREQKKRRRRSYYTYSESSHLFLGFRSLFKISSVSEAAAAILHEFSDGIAPPLPRLLRAVFMVQIKLWWNELFHYWQLSLSFSGSRLVYDHSEYIILFIGKRRMLCGGERAHETSNQRVLKDS